MRAQCNKNTSYSLISFVHYSGTVAGIVSGVGYKIVGGKIFAKLRIHDTCGVNNLHGMPGIMAGLLSIIVTLLASEETRGGGGDKVGCCCLDPEGG